MARYRGPRGLVALTQVVTSFTPHEDTGACVALGRSETDSRMFLLSVWWRWAEGGGQIVISLGHTRLSAPDTTCMFRVDSVTRQR